MNWVVLCIFGLFTFMAALLGVSFLATLGRAYWLSRAIRRRRREGSFDESALVRAAAQARELSGMGKRTQRVTMAVAAAGGAALLGIGLSLCREARDLRANSAHAPGIVSGFMTSGGNDFPRVSFRSSPTESVTFAARLGGGGPFAYQEGDAVSVLYDPLHPGSARIDSFSQLWFVPIFVSLFGAVLLLVPALFLVTAAHERLRLALEGSKSGG